MVRRLCVSGVGVWKWCWDEWSKIFYFLVDIGVFYVFGDCVEWVVSFICNYCGMYVLVVDVVRDLIEV